MKLHPLTEASIASRAVWCCQCPDALVNGRLLCTWHSGFETGVRTVERCERHGDGTADETGVRADGARVPLPAPHRFHRKPCPSCGSNNPFCVVCYPDRNP